jgi:hypothetical protein
VTAGATRGLNALPSRVRGVGTPNRAWLTGRRSGWPLGDWFGSAIRQVGVMVSRGGLVLLDDAGGDVAAAAKRDTLVFRPGPDFRVAPRLAVVRPGRCC